MDNVNIPIYAPGATTCRITATHPRYYPTSISAWGADWDDCTFADRGIWLIGEKDGAYTEFQQGWDFTNGDTFFAPDNPPAGVDEAADAMPRELNNDWMHEQFVRFTADEDSDVNLEARIGARFTVRMAMVSGTIEVKALTLGAEGWADHGNQVFSPGQLVGTWDIPDLTWREGTDTNAIHLRVVRQCEPGSVTTTNAWAYYDYLELRKRDEAGDNAWNPTVLYSDSNTVVETVHIDFWWRYPAAMTVEVPGGATDTNAHYLRIKRRMPFTTNDWNEVLVLYEDGNARIIPFPPHGLHAVPYGGSIILGPSEDSSRPFCQISRVVVDPATLTLHMTYGDGRSALARLRVDRERNVVDVTNLSGAADEQPFARFRSMWVHDGKTDIDRVESAWGSYPLMDGWTALPGSWWFFTREVPSYHNTYCPDFRIELMDPGAADYRREMEAFDSGSGGEVIAEQPDASGGAVLAMAAAGGEVVYLADFAAAISQAVVRVSYADADGGNGIDVFGKSIHLIVDGAITARTFSAHTGDTNVFAMTPSLPVGDLSAGAHEFRFVTGTGTVGVVLDSFDIVSQASRPAERMTLAVRQCESWIAAEPASAAEIETRPSAVGGDTVHMEGSPDTWSSVTYDVNLAEACEHVWMRVRYSDDVPANEIRVYANGVCKARFPSTYTGGWHYFTNGAPLYLGALNAGEHEIELSIWNGNYGVDLDEFELFTLNRAPMLRSPADAMVPVGSATQLLFEVFDDDGEEVVLGSIAVPAGSTLDGGTFAWTAGAADEGSTQQVILVADDQRGFGNSRCTNGLQILVPRDWDEDEMPDGWEWTHFGSLTNEAGADMDGDVASNWEEWIAGSDPANSRSLFSVVPEEGPQGDAVGFSVTIQTQPGRAYRVYYRDALSSEGMGTWNPFARVEAGTWSETGTVSGSHTFLDDGTPETSGAPFANGRRYYRVGVRMAE